jgi:spermidine synthase
MVLTLSGAAGVIYEAMWSRYLGHIVGHTAYSQIVVLTVFLAGLAIGTAIAAKISERIRRPLIIYAALELALCIAGLSFTYVYTGASDWLFTSVFSSDAPLWAHHLTKWLTCAALILPQSILLGATYPLVVQWIAGQGTERKAVSMTYAANSIGGAVGVLLGGFYFVPRWGLPGTMIATATLNLLAAAVALTGAALVPRGSEAASTNENRNPLPPTSLQYWMILVVAFGTAATSFIYEVAWVRMISLLLGSSTHAFELMLSAFVLGIGIGGIVAGRLDQRMSPVERLGRIQVYMAVSVLIAAVVYGLSFAFVAYLPVLLAFDPDNYALYSVIRYALCLLLMLPVSICVGATFPLVVEIAGRLRRRSGTVGRMYAINTLGCIVGVTLAGLVGLPLLGIRILLLAGAAIDAALGVWLLRNSGTRSAGRLGLTNLLSRVIPGRGAVSAGHTPAIPLLYGLCGAVLLFNPHVWTHGKVTSGLFRATTAELHGKGSGNSTALDEGEARLLFYADGRTATISVAGDTAKRWLATNGKTDASLRDLWLDSSGKVVAPLRRDELTQVLLPLFGFMYQPRARRAAIVGFGSGISSHVALSLPSLQTFESIEIEPGVMRGAKYFLPANARAFTDPRSKIVIADAREYLTRARDKYEVIISEPSNPWVSGVSTLFTVEFYQKASAHLTADGVFTQWIHTYDLTDEMLLHVMSALQSVFPIMDVYRVEADMIIVARKSQAGPPMDWGTFIGSLHADPLVAAAARISPKAMLVGSQDLVRSRVMNVVPNRDLFPVLDVSAERARFLASRVRGWEAPGSAGGR